jgi:dihydrofolate reductase
MRKVIVDEFMSLDGVMQAPGGEEEDTSGGFQHGGWSMQYIDEPAQKQVIAEPLNTKPKYVASRTQTELEWQNSTVLDGDLVDAVTALKQEDGGDLHVIGSTELVQSLLDLGLVDELRLMINPVVVGGGKGIFRDDGQLRPLRLVESETTPSGAIFATYAPA